MGHPRYVDGSGWTKARELREGDLLRSKEGTGHLITAIRVRTLERDEQVYTLQVSECASFYVGKVSVLVHNKTLPPARP